MRIALFGGSFDPPHRGHVAIARAAADAFALDKVFFTPAARQPLKSAPATASYADRFAMVTLACAEDQRFAPSDLDAPHAEPNYTIRTLNSLTELFPEARIFNIAGADSFATLARWRDPEKLLKLAEWIVVSRPGHALADPAGLVLNAERRTRIHLLDSVHENVAATELRRRLEQGDPCKDLLPASVSHYIHQHHLYLASTRTRP
jgi:nicotinate-nucleotide adenylyltransferase